MHIFLALFFSFSFSVAHSTPSECSPICQKVESFWHDWDTDYNGTLSSSEFGSHSFAMKVLSWKYFTLLDLNLDGQLSKTEWRLSSRKLDIKQAALFEKKWNTLDTDQNSFISLAESKAWPALFDLFKEVDTNLDKQISKTEAIHLFYQTFFRMLGFD